MATRTDNRGQWTIKHNDIGPEFQTLIRKAAERQGMTVGAFVVETLRERAQAIVKGIDGTPQGPPQLPVRLDDIRHDITSLAERMQAMIQAQGDRLTRIEQQGTPARGADRQRFRRWRR